MKIHCRVLREKVREILSYITRSTIQRALNFMHRISIDVVAWQISDLFRVHVLTRTFSPRIQ